MFYTFLKTGARLSCLRFAPFFALFSSDDLSTALVKYLRKPIALLLAPLVFEVLYSIHFFVSFLFFLVEHNANNYAVGQKVNEYLSVLIDELQYQPSMRGLHLTVIFAVIKMDYRSELGVSERYEATTAI